MLSRNQIKQFASLRDKKYREKYNQFLAEGEKIVGDILRFPQGHIRAEILLATEEFIRNDVSLISDSKVEIITVTPGELDRVSTLSTPNKAILVCRKPVFDPDFGKISRHLSVLLEDIRDPGNMGTIIRSADWFGIEDIFCSSESVDVFNPKVIQSTMGSICRVKVHYADPAWVISQLKSFNETKVFGAVLNGRNIYREKLDGGLLVLGNESQGISRKIMKMLDVKLTIPSGAGDEKGSESLNIASAAAILFSEFSRRTYSK